ncbi:5-deoxy-glucuronate isomerase [Ligilactobacillus sp. WILCCON 0076]|uniref:5-deoxy-glucuronate isomerase n=1 Tax=Ligilactobacillus ubinensis TaxID=2876789 RepID=A0A9X2FN92_9LACO|nr:5-deoxy-glucuronate isomerase [Ligilactobacillus ubinensis]MCP0887496.1 5-deoxy-glucuronate isomerase [Ligilactobacillus ubinensis]
MSLLYHSQNNLVFPGVNLIQQVDEQNSPMKYTGLKVLTIEKSYKYIEKEKAHEVGIVILTGKATVKVNDETFENIGQRQSVFDKIPTDSVYAGVGSSIEVIAETDCKILMAYSPTEKKFPTRLLKGDIHQIEHRGKYNNKRLVQNILPDDLPFADKLLLVEVYTESANWSSYPPHRHDHDNLPTESFLEEIYYHEMNPKTGFVFQHVYTDDHSLDETMTVNSGDVVVVPKGYHPVAVPDGFESYYLNIMAGPSRIWKFHNDPDLEWIINRK